MATPFRRLFSMKRFDGGLNNKFEPSIIDDNESPDCQNVVYDDLGAVQTRDGFTQLNTATVGTLVCDGLFVTKFSPSVETMVGFWGGVGYTLDTTSFITIGSAQSVFTAGQQVNYTQYQNHMFIGNGGPQPYKYNGTDFTRHGIEAPTSAPTIACNATGALTGLYNYKVTWVNSALVEGDVGIESESLTVASAVISLTSIPIAPQSYGVNSRKIYRTETSGTTFLLVTTISDNTTTTYTDSTVDADLGSAAPNDVGEPPQWAFCITFKDRLFAVDTTNSPQFVYYSDLGEPYTWPSSNFIKIDQGDGEEITGLGIQQNSLIVYKRNSVWLIYMQDTTASNWVVIKTDSKYGCESHKSIVNYSNLQMFLGQSLDNTTGFYALAGNTLQPDKTDLTVTSVFSDSKAERIEPDVFKIQESASPKTVGIFFKNKLWFSVPYDSGATTNNRIFQFDFHRAGKSRALGSWVPFTGINASEFTVYASNLYFADYAGLVHKLEAGVYSDNGAAIDSYFWTKEYEGPIADSDFEKDYRFANFTIENLGDWNIGIGHRTDSDLGGGDIEQVNTDAGGSNWGAMVWGQDDWGGGNTRSNTKVELGNKVGKRIQFRFDNQNTADRAFKIVRGNFYYNRRGYR